MWDFVGQGHTYESRHAFSDTYVMERCCCCATVRVNAIVRATTVAPMLCNVNKLHASPGACWVALCMMGIINLLPRYRSNDRNPCTQAPLCRRVENFLTAMLRGIYCLGVRYRGGQGSIIRESDCALRDTSAGSMVVLWRYQAILTLACEKGGGCAFVPDGSRDHLPQCLGSRIRVSKGLGM